MSKLTRAVPTARVRLSLSGAGGLQPGFAAVDHGLQRLRVDLQQKVARFDAVALAHGQSHDAPDRAGADVDRQLWLDFPRGRDEGFERPSLNGLDVDSGASELPEPKIEKTPGRHRSGLRGPL